MKKVLALLLAMCILFSLAACGGSSSNGGKASDEPKAQELPSQEPAVSGDESQDTPPAELKEFIVGFPEAPVEVPAVLAIKINTQKVVETAGGTLKNEIFDFTPEGTVDAVEKIIANGADGVIITPSSESIIPTVLNMCEESGVYFILSMRTIEDESIRAMCEASKYFLGCVYEDDYAAGYALGKALYEAGETTYALIGTAVGDTTGDTRERGLAAAAEEFGLTCVSEVRALAQASDAASAVESFLAAYPDLGGIIRIASTAAGDVSAICTALEEAGKAGDVKFVTIDVDDESAVEHFKKGTITATLGNALSLDRLIATSILVNAILGTPVSDKPVYICIPFPVITTADELTMDTVYTTSTNGLYPEEVIRERLLKYFNPDVTLESILEQVDNYDLNYIASLWE
ncbi:MAG: sugar ABC transporter substrate-binding protein [Oscillospiraceae bacterium]